MVHVVLPAVAPGPEDGVLTVLTKMLGDYLAEDEPGKDLVLVKRVKDRARVRSVPDRDRHAQTGMHPSIAATLTPTEVEVSEEWLRRHTPMRDRVFRTTRQTMRDYQDAGILAADVSIPVRDVNDVFIPLSDDEDKMYRRIEDYISKHYNAYMQNQQKALGFYDGLPAPSHLVFRGDPPVSPTAPPRTWNRPRAHGDARRRTTAAPLRKRQLSTRTRTPN